MAYINVFPVKAMLKETPIMINKEKKNVCRKEEMCDAGKKMRDIWLVLVLTSLLILDIGVKRVLEQGHLFAKIPCPVYEPRNME